jgi:elongation factor P
MISTNDFKTGQTIVFDGNIYQVIEFQHVKPGKGGAFVRTKLRNLRSGSVTDYTFNAGIKVERAMIDKVKVQYLYKAEPNCVFMKLDDSYEQIEIPIERIKDELNYISEAMEVELSIFNGSEMLGVILPDKVVLEVVDTISAVAGNTKTNSNKDATLSTGLVIKVPLFIDAGERVVVSTYDGTYVSREKN